jgi:hypothetical protein
MKAKKSSKKIKSEMEQTTNASASEINAASTTVENIVHQDHPLGAEVLNNPAADLNREMELARDHQRVEGEIHLCEEDSHHYITFGADTPENVVENLNEEMELARDQQAAQQEIHHLELPGQLSDCDRFYRFIGEFLPEDWSFAGIKRHQHLIKFWLKKWSERFEVFLYFDQDYKVTKINCMNYRIGSKHLGELEDILNKIRVFSGIPAEGKAKKMDAKAEFFIERRLRKAMNLIGCNLVTYQRKPGGYIRVVLNHPRQEVIWVKLVFRSGRPYHYRIQTRCLDSLRKLISKYLEILGFKP